MATNTDKGSRKGAVSGRVQVLNPRTDRWIKLDTATGRILDQKKSNGPYKGIKKK